jgi:hypothetical protein
VPLDALVHADLMHGAKPSSGPLRHAVNVPVDDPWS